MSAEHQTSVLIIGGGPAGYTAALYAARAGLAPSCIEGFDSGGQISRATVIENFPGASEGTSGAALSARMREQAAAFGALFLFDDVSSVHLDTQPFTVTTSGASVSAQSVIIATGSRPRTLGLAGEEELIGRGIAYCALCDGAFFTGMDVVVVGGGNAALGEAMAMARLASRVTLIHRRNEFRADAIVEQAARTTGGIQILTPFIVEDLVTSDEGALCAVQIRDTSSGECTYRETGGLFVSIGHEPMVELFTPFVDVAHGHILTGGTSTATSRRGVFAAGDVADSRYRQAITAAASGCMAAIDAERWLGTGEWIGPDPETAQRQPHSLQRR